MATYGLSILRQQVSVLWPPLTTSQGKAWIGFRGVHGCTLNPRPRRGSWGACPALAPPVIRQRQDDTITGDGQAEVSLKMKVPDAMETCCRLLNDLQGTLLPEPQPKPTDKVAEGHGAPMDAAPITAKCNGVGERHNSKGH